jgi:hypothetical protein
VKRKTLIVETLIVVLVCGLVGLPVVVRSQSTRGQLSTTEEVLKIYANLTHRTVLRPTFLPPLAESVLSQIPTDTNAAVVFIEKELTNIEVDVVRDGEWFVRVLPAGWKASPMGPLLDRIRPPPPRDAQASDELVPAGMMNFQGAMFEDIIMIYSSFRGRTVLRPAAPFVQEGVFRTETPLTRQEIIYGMTVLMTLNGLVVVDDGEHLVQIVPARLAPNVRAHAPKSDASAERIAPDKVPVFSRGWSSAREIRPPKVDGLVAYYAELSGRTATPSEKVGQRPVTFEVGTPLTRDELRYAIETTLGFDGLAIAFETNTIHAVRLSVNSQ